MTRFDWAALGAIFALAGVGLLIVLDNVLGSALLLALAFGCWYFGARSGR